MYLYGEVGQVWQVQFYWVVLDFVVWGQCQVVCVVEVQWFEVVGLQFGLVGFVVWQDEGYVGGVELQWFVVEEVVYLYLQSVVFSSGLYQLVEVDVVKWVLCWVSLFELCVVLGGDLFGGGWWCCGCQFVVGE